MYLGLPNKLYFIESTDSTTKITMSIDTFYSLIEYKGFKLDRYNYLNWKKRRTFRKGIKDFGNLFYRVN